MEESSRLYIKEIRVIELIKARLVRLMIRMINAHSSRSALILSKTNMPRLIT
jgi:hypothetical protein